MVLLAVQTGLLHIHDIWLQCNPKLKVLTSCNLLLGKNLDLFNYTVIIATTQCVTNFSLEPIMLLNNLAAALHNVTPLNSP